MRNRSYVNQCLSSKWGMAGPKDTSKQRANMQARNEARYQKRLQQALEAREQLKGKVPDEWLELLVPKISVIESQMPIAAFTKSSDGRGFGENLRR